MRILVFCMVCAAMLTGYGAFAQPVTFTVDAKKQAQTVENFGAAGAWFTEEIGRHWPSGTKERMAELLFSKAFDQNGNPLGIGLSAWRFNVGGGTAEQGKASGISNPQKRVECFLSPNGTYDWNKQQGYLWFTKKAASYGVKDLILFSNTPPVQFTKNGLGFKTEKSFTANLREEAYGEYAGFLATVIQHFDKEGLHFSYVSPVNEPQWDWSGKPGQMSQEGSPWHNKEIYKIAASLDSALSSKKLSTKILLTEAGDLKSLYEGNWHASRQVQNFYSPGSPFFFGHLKHVHPVIAGHSYFTDTGDTTLLGVRKRLADTVAAYGLSFWQSEYSLLSNGYREGFSGRRTAMDCALFLAKVIYHDLVIGNATAWHFWNSWEPGRADFDTRYFLLALQNKADSLKADFAVTKNLWALGHFSRFIRPGMTRLVTKRSDGRNEMQAANDLLLAAFGSGKKIVAVAVNYTTAERQMALQLAGAGKPKSIERFVTTADAHDNMRRQPLSSVGQMMLPPRSLTTIVLEMK